MRFLTNVVADILTHIYTNEFHNAQFYIHPCVIIKTMTACYLKDYIHVKYLDGEILGYIRGNLGEGGAVHDHTPHFKIYS